MAKFNMNQNKKQSTKTDRPQLDELHVESYRIGRLHVWDNGGISFDLTINNALTIYNCRLAANKDGEAFVAWPARKGSDGKYYSHVYARLSAADTDKICQAVIDAANA